MMTKNNIPAGYKYSAVGVIPQEWEVKRLGTIAKSFSGGTPKSESEEMYGGTIPFIRSGEIHSNKTALFLTDDGLRKSSAKMVDVGDLIFALYGANSGDCAISQINGAINQAILCIRSSSVINPFLQPYLELQKDRFIAKYLQGGQGNLSGEIVCSYTIHIPPLAEQRKIAEILGVWDEAIEKQSRLIEKLELRKRALIQRLLTGRTRLPGFTTPWQKVKLGKIGKTYNGLTSKSKEDFEDGNAKFIPYINVFLNEKVNIDKLGVVSVDESEKQNKVQYGDIFFTVSSETPDEVGMASVLLEYIDDTYLNSFCFGYRLNDFETLNPIFASYILRGDRFRNYMMVLAQGSTRFNISKNEVMKLRIELPSPSEQKAIAEVLTTADNEIATHRKKLDALRLQKRGLMQQLLTGKTRVKI